MLENPQHTFWLKLLSVNFLFMSSIWTGKSFFYILADFALFAFIVTLIYVHVVSFLEKKNLAQSEKEVEFVSRDMISEVVSPIVQKLNSLLTVVLSATLKQSLVLIVLLIVLALISTVLPSILLMWAASILYLLNEEASRNQKINEYKEKVMGYVNSALNTLGLRKD